MNTYLNKQNAHLILSAGILILASLLYGLYPERILPELFEVEIDSVDLKNIFRAIMCLYLGIAWILVLGILKPEYWKFATLLSLVFMGCLAFGRVLSFILDGSPSMFLILGFFGEMILAVFSFWQLRYYKREGL